ncbi:hypothetical protein [Actinomadura harenae]|uniref:Heavy metal translocating P-type ATPase n=1 Tax=Actinomadura harenae TaxID=2483351 RepID=A0A3M2LJW6_9ACTN|nr:hypothetical protein [Actinomadura harenae]RMI37731.1 hypothetical protein EBO15_35035 [Actinomadura harenae]
MEAPQRSVSRRLWDLRYVALLVVTLSGLIAGGVCWWADARHAADVIWTVVTAIALVPAVWAVVQGLMRRGVGSDVIAVLAPAGTLATGEFLAGAVIAVMLTGDQAPHRHHRPQEEFWYFNNGMSP